VRTIRKASEEEVLDCFWRGEAAPASRWTEAQNEDRKLAWREREGLFDGFPRDVSWERVALTRDEVLAILYINWDWWLEISGGTRLPRWVDVSHADRGVAAVAATNPELIVVTDPRRSKLVLLEGHVRLTAYAAFPELLPDELEVFLGTSSDMPEWSEW
jgi:hypothetical protein